MTIRIVDNIGISEGLELLSADLGVETAEEGCTTVFAEPSLDGVLRVKISGSKVIINAPTKAAFFRGFVRAEAALKAGDEQVEFCEKPIFEDVGAMVDMSRNGAMNLFGVKEMLKKCALMGMTTFMLYTEDNYEIDGYPYFGHLRGRYTKSELRELDSYALKLGIELIPCIQTSGHLATHLIWGAASGYRDTSSTLLSGADETYELIHAMMTTVSECFTTRRIHIGMDEARDLGSGKYLERFGYKKRSEIFLEHLTRVTEIVRSYGFEPMMWSDMFFRLAADGKIPGYRDYDVRVEMTDEIAKKVPEGVTQVFWDYYHEDEEFYIQNIDKHRKYFTNKLIFAGGVYLWCGHCPLYKLTKMYSVPALYACRERGVSEVLATVWLSGSEGMHILSLAGLALYADFAYRGEYDEGSVAECFELATGEDYYAVMTLEAPEHPDGGVFSLSRPLLYNDPLMGNADVNFAMLPLREYYQSCSRDIEKAKIKTELFSYPYECIGALSLLLENKADFGIKLKTAYDAGDRDELSSLCSECDLIIEEIETLRQKHRAVWMKFCKSAGWEVHDIRYGGLKARFETVKYKILAFLSGEVDSIEELDLPRLAIDCKEENIGKFTDAYTGIKYMTYATVNVL